MPKPTQAQHGADLALQNGLPHSLEDERAVLGAILQRGERYEEAASVLTASDFFLEKHRRTFLRMGEIHARGEKVERLALINELRVQGQLESVDGIGWIVSLDEDLPDIVELASYLRRVKEKSNLRAIIFSAQRTMDRAMHGIESAQDIAAGAVETLSVVQSGQDKEDEGRTPEEVIQQYSGGIVAFLDPTKRKRGIPTGFKRLDEVTAGLHQGQLIVVGARPGVGKSAWAMNVAAHLTLNPKQRRPVAYFSLEMTADALLTRLLCAHARVDAYKFRAGYLNQDERYKLQIGLDDIINSRLKIFDKFGMTTMEFCKHVRRLTKDEGCQLAILDYLQLMGVKSKGENRNLEISEMTRQIKILAGECGIPIMVLSQLSRSSEKRTGKAQVPILSDLRDSGSIESDADVVMFLDRRELRERDRDDIKGQAELIIAKQREGQCTTVNLMFLGQYVSFSNRAESLDDPEPLE